MKVKITYIKHSSFSIEMDDKVLIFDYYKGILPEFPKNKKIYFFSSHVHYDHYNDCIFEYSDDYKDVSYILSDDIVVNEDILRRHQIGENIDKLVFVKSNETVYLDDLKISTLKSTDEGVAFIVYIDDRAIYHAGDLNWWHWNSEPDEWNKDMENAYKAEIEKIRGQSFFLAFLPLDGRLEDKYALGLDYFVTHTQSKYVFPMHCFGKYRVMDQIKEAAFARDYVSSLMLSYKEGQSWIFDQDGRFING